MIVLYVVADRGVFENDGAYFAMLDRLHPVVRAHPGTVLQVRAKGLTAREKQDFVAGVRAILGDSVKDAFLNGGAHEARAAGFGGVHWPEVAIPAAPTDGLLAGASVHSLAALRRAEAAGAAFALFGPVFDAGSKPVSGVGLAALWAITRASRIPVLAIGGVTPANVAACVAAGAVGVAAVTGVLRSRDPGAAIGAYLSALQSASRHGQLLATSSRKDLP